MIKQGEFKIMIFNFYSSWILVSTFEFGKSILYSVRNGNLHFALFDPDDFYVKMPGEFNHSDQVWGHLLNFMCLILLIVQFIYCKKSKSIQNDRFPFAMMLGFISFVAVACIAGIYGKTLFDI